MGENHTLAGVFPLHESLSFSRRRHASRREGGTGARKQRRVGRSQADAVAPVPRHLLLMTPVQIGAIGLVSSPQGDAMSTLRFMIIKKQKQIKPTLNVAENPTSPMTTGATESWLLISMTLKVTIWKRRRLKFTLRILMGRLFRILWVGLKCNPRGPCKRGAEGDATHR